MWIIGKIDRNLYRIISDQIRTDEVIITDERVAHIMARHPGDFEEYSAYMRDMIEDPQYILATNLPNTAFLLKKYVEENRHFQLILRIAVEGEPEGYMNSVITFLKISEKKFKKYLRNKKILYKADQFGYNRDKIGWFFEVEILVSPYTFEFRRLTRDAGTGTPAKEPDCEGTVAIRSLFLQPFLCAHCSGLLSQISGTLRCDHRRSRINQNFYLGRSALYRALL